MAITVTKDTRFPNRVSQGNKVGQAILTGSIAFDSSYPTGGEDAGDISDYFRNLDSILIEAAGGYSFEYDATNDKIKAYWVDTTVDGAPQAEVANTTDLSGVTAAKFVATGRLI